MRAFTCAALVLVFSVSATGVAAQDRDARVAPTFRFERPVDISDAGPRRLVVDVTLLSGARRDLGDLRLFGATGEEIPYLLIQPTEMTPQWIAGGVLAIPATEKTSGFEADFHESALVDALRVGGLPVPLLKRLSLEGSGDREHWAVLLPEATLFDLPADGLQQLELTFQPGNYRYLRVTWNDANTGRVPLPSFVQSRRVMRGVANRVPLSATLGVERRSGEPGMSRYRLRLPASGLPLVALKLVVENERVMRHAVVTEPRLSGTGVVPFELGRAALKRVVRGDAAAEALTIPIAAPIGPQLDLAVDDGNNPPLQLTSVVALFARQPDVYFEAAGVPVVARYGNRRLTAPRYDLAAARDTVQIDIVPEAKWGEPRPLASEETAPPAAPPSAARGATVDVAGFATMREIPPGPAGLVSLEMDAAALAHSTGPARGFSDVRIVDQEGRQVPYLLEQCVTPLVTDLPLTRRQPTGKVPNGRRLSEYSVRTSYAGLPASRVVLTTSARVFTRRVEIGSARPADRSHRDPWFQALAEADWTHDDNATAAPSLVLALPPVDDTEVVLRIEEGDNAALPVTSAKLTLPGYRLRFYRSANERLTLAYGQSDLSAPRYDIQLLSADILGRVATDIEAADENGSQALQPSSLVSPRVFWIVLGLAVVVLLGMTARLVRKGS